MEDSHVFTMAISLVGANRMACPVTRYGRSTKITTVLWIGTYDGVQPASRMASSQFYSEEGLFNNGVFQILEDRRSNLWISCNRGIYRVSKRELNGFAVGSAPH